MAMALPPSQSRPGLAMTFEEFKEAKVLILDLLGWGLSPENLVEAGISKHCLVPCLRELKLRLPSNIDLSDVVFFDPPSDALLPSHSSIPPSSATAGGKPAGAQHNVNDGNDMANVAPFTPQRTTQQLDGGRRRNSTSMTPPGLAPITSDQATASLLDRLLLTADKEAESNGTFQPAGIERDESYTDGPSADTTGGPALPLRGQKKQGRNPQGGRPPSVSRRKMQGHGSSKETND